MEEINNNDQAEIRVAMPSSHEDTIRKLYETTNKGCIESLKRLIEENPSVIQKVVNETHHPLLHLSISNGHLEFTRLLLHYEPRLAVEIDSLQRTPLHLASELGEMEMVEALLEKNMSTCFVYDSYGLIPLHYAVLFGQTDIMQKLIKEGPRSLWMKLENNGQTVLHLCVEKNHLEGMKLLIETYVNKDEDFLNTIDDNGDTILDLSIKLRQSEMMEYLFSVSKVKTRTSIENFEGSSSTKKSLDQFQKISKTRNFKRQKSKKLGSKKMTGPRWKAWRKNLEYEGDWFQEVQGTMMLVATVIASVTFQAGVNPPGGVWQQDTTFNSSSNFHHYYYYRVGVGLNNTSFEDNRPVLNLHPAGTAIMNFEESYEYETYLWLNSISFLASISVILLVVGRFPLRNKICSWLLALAMCVAVVSLGIGYINGVRMVNFKQFNNLNGFYSFYLTVISCLGVVRVVGIWHFISFWVWVVKTLSCTFVTFVTSKIKRHNFNNVERP